MHGAEIKNIEELLGDNAKLYRAPWTKDSVTDVELATTGKGTQIDVIKDWASYVTWKPNTKTPLTQGWEAVVLPYVDSYYCDVTDTLAPNRTSTAMPNMCGTCCLLGTVTHLIMHFSGKDETPEPHNKYIFSLEAIRVALNSMVAWIPNMAVVEMLWKEEMAAIFDRLKGELDAFNPQFRPTPWTPSRPSR